MNEEAGDGDWGTVPAAVPVPLERWFDNDGIDTADAPGGDFDGSGYTFPGEELPAGRLEIDGIAYLFPAATAGTRNNIVALGQRVELPEGRYLSGLFLVAGSYGAASGKATVHYADGTTQTAALGGPDWYSGSGTLTAPYRRNPAGQKDPHQVVIATAEVAMDPAKDAVALTLPVTNPAEPNKSALHIFALTLQPAAQGRALTLRAAHATTSLLDSGAQSVEATVINAGTIGILAPDHLTLSVDVPGARTVAPAPVARLAPGEQARVRIGIRRSPGTPPGTSQDCAVVARGARSPSGCPTTGPPTPRSAPIRRRTGSRTRSSGSSSTGASTPCPRGRRSASSTPSGTGAICRPRTTRRTPITARGTESLSPTTTSSRASRPNVSTRAPGSSCSATPARGTTY